MRIEMYKAIDWYVDNPLELVYNPGDIAIRLETDSISVSVFTDDGECIGCGGILYWGDKWAEAWIRIDKKGLEYKKSGIRAIRAGFRIITRSVRDARVFCWVDTKWPEAQRLVKWLGFTEGEELKELNNSIYRLWEYKNGNGVNDIGNGSISCGADSAGQDDATASRGPSRDK